MSQKKIPQWLREREIQLLADALLANLQSPPRKRTRRLRKVSEHVKRTWVSAGCFGEAVQWRLAKRKRNKKGKGT